MWSIIALTGHLPLYAAGRLDCIHGAATQRVNAKRWLRVTHCYNMLVNSKVASVQLANSDTAYSERYMGFANSNDNYRGYDVSIHTFVSTYLYAYTSMCVHTCVHILVCTYIHLVHGCVHVHDLVRMIENKLATACVVQSTFVWLFPTFFPYFRMLMFHGKQSISWERI